MTELIIRVLRGEATTAERDRLRQWRHESEENECAFHEITKVWELSASGARTQSSRTPTSAEILVRVHARSGDEPAPPRRLGWQMPAAAAAGVLLLFALNPFGSKEVPLALAVEELRTGAGETVTLNLADGSTVHLAPHSHLRVASSRERREIWMTGRAFFAVASDPERPFVVRTAAGDAMALGTQFEVRQEAGRLEVMVLQGRVEVSSTGGATQITRGEMSEVFEGGQPTRKQVHDPNAWLDWTRNFLVFDGVPLSVVAVELRRIFGLNIEFLDTAAAERTVRASFNRESSEQVLDVICRIADVSCVSEGGTVLVGLPEK